MAEDGQLTANQMISTESIDENIHIERYNPNWARDFHREAKQILRALDFISVSMEHIGSTAVEGILAKPIIDIMVGIDKLPPNKKTIIAFKDLDYEYFGQAGVSGRYYFRKRGERSFNIALVKRDGPLWAKNLRFRDFLKANPTHAKKYSNLKKQIIKEEYTTLFAYSDAKSDFIQKLILKAEV